MIIPKEYVTEEVVESLHNIFKFNEVKSIAYMDLPQLSEQPHQARTVAELCAQQLSNMCGVIVDDNRIQSAGLLIEMARCHLDQQSRALDAGGVHNDITIGQDLSATVCTVDGALTNTSRPAKMARTCHDKDGSDSDDDDRNKTIAAAAAAATATMTAASSSAAIAWNDL